MPCAISLQPSGRPSGHIRNVSQTVTLVGFPFFCGWFQNHSKPKNNELDVPPGVEKHLKADTRNAHGRHQKRAQFNHDFDKYRKKRMDDLHTYLLCLQVPWDAMLRGGGKVQPSRTCHDGGRGGGGAGAPYRHVAKAHFPSFDVLSNGSNLLVQPNLFQRLL